MKNLQPMLETHFDKGTSLLSKSFRVISPVKFVGFKALTAARVRQTVRELHGGAACWTLTTSAYLVICPHFTSETFKLISSLSNQSLCETKNYSAKKNIL